MSQSGLTPKQARIVEKDVETLFAPRALLSNPTIETIKRVGLFHPTVKFKDNTLFLSVQGVAAVRRLTDLICGLPMLAGFVSRSEIRNQVMKSYNTWIAQLLQPTGQEFTEAVTEALLATVREHEFLIQIEGIDLVDQDILDLGPVRIQRSNPTFLDKVKFGGALDRGSVYALFKDSLWLVGTSRGSPDISLEQFEQQAVVTVGILAVCGAILYPGGLVCVQ